MRQIVKFLFAISFVEVVVEEMKSFLLMLDSIPLLMSSSIIIKSVIFDFFSFHHHRCQTTANRDSTRERTLQAENENTKLILPVLCVVLTFQFLDLALDCQNRKGQFY